MKRKIVILVITLGLGALLVTESNVSAANGCHSRRDGRYNCYVWKTAPSYFPGNRRAGTLYKGWNYFYCQAVGSRVYLGPYYNKWWAKTDDDSGNTRVWVNDVYLQGGRNDEPVPGLPWCR